MYKILLSDNRISLHNFFIVRWHLILLAIIAPSVFADGQRRKRDKEARNLCGVCIETSGPRCKTSDASIPCQGIPCSLPFNQGLIKSAVLYFVGCVVNDRQELQQRLSI
jgi:hypothetical protein